MRAEEFILDEGWRDNLKGAALAGALATSSMAAPDAQAHNTPMEPHEHPGASHVVAPMEIPSLSGTTHEVELRNTGLNAGMSKDELASFMGQLAHESWNFKHMEEQNSKNYANYEPNTPTGKRLGNTQKGDGKRFKGRGYIQLTGRWNYGAASKALGVDLIKNPELAADPKIASKIALWYWNKRVRPNVTNWKDLKQVTQNINPKLNGMQDRGAKTNEFADAFDRLEQHGYINFR
jgi:predicted chitinase